MNKKIILLAVAAIISIAAIPTPLLMAAPEPTPVPPNGGEPTPTPTATPSLEEAVKQSVYARPGFSLSKATPSPIPTRTPTPTPTPIPIPPRRKTPAEIGVNVGWVTTTWGAIPDDSFYDLVKSTGADWVRVEFMLRPWDSPTSQERHQGRTWFEAHDAIVNGFTSRGIKVYALIGAPCAGPTKIHVGEEAEAVDIFREYPGPYPDLAESWIEEYTRNFVAIAQHFKGRIDTYELFNEPDDWDGKIGPVIHPCWFARMLEEIYSASKTGGHLEAPFIHVSINSGPLEGLDVATGANYLAQTYYYGIRWFRWREVKRLTGSYPLDGVGYHIYVAQDTSQEEEISTRLSRCLDAIWRIIVVYEGGQTQKRIRISEIGWPSVTDAQYQARALTKSFDILRYDGRIETVIWFTLIDFNTPEKGHVSYGLYEIPKPWGELIPKPALDAFKRQTEKEREDNSPAR